ncbi:IS66 family transposase, partial [Yersinia similis]
QQTQRNQTQAGYIQQLEEALKNARQWRFGRKSEAFQGEQRGLFDEDIEADAADIGQQLATLLPEPKATKTQVAKRQPLPAQLIEKGLPGPGLLAQVVCAKSLDHLPLYRQQVIYQRSGVDLPRSTLAGWFGAVGAALKPLAQALHQDLLQHPVLQADETPLSILDPGKGKTQRGYLWAYITALGADRSIVLYDCQPGRSGQYARDVLAGWRGTL